MSGRDKKTQAPSSLQSFPFVSSWIMNECLNGWLYHHQRKMEKSFWYPIPFHSVYDLPNLFLLLLLLLHLCTLFTCLLSSSWLNNNNNSKGCCYYTTTALLIALFNLSHRLRLRFRLHLIIIIMNYDEFYISSTLDK